MSTIKVTTSSCNGREQEEWQFYLDGSQLTLELTAYRKFQTPPRGRKLRCVEIWLRSRNEGCAPTGVARLPLPPLSDTIAEAARRQACDRVRVIREILPSTAY